MLKVIIRVPDDKPRMIALKGGRNHLGRSPQNELFVDDHFASRQHAAIDYDLDTRDLLLTDLNSSNGTYLNQQRITGTVPIKLSDTIRIGRCIITFNETMPIEPSTTGNFYNTRDMLLSSLDRNALLMSEAARQLNMMVDLRSALMRVSELMKQAMDSDRCAVILPDKFDKVDRLGFPRSLAETVITHRSAVIIPNINTLADERARRSGLLHGIQSALCVPILNGDDLLGLIFLTRTLQNINPFTSNDLELAVGISHQAALTIQRMRLIEDVQKEQQTQNLLRRFVSPTEADQLFRHYLETGQFPDLEVGDRTILFADIADSSRLAEKLEPSQFAKLLQEYYSTAIQVVFDQGGIIKLLGDGIMATFGPVNDKDLPELRATYAGLTLLEKIHQYNKEHPDPQIVIGVGVTTGPVVSGYVGSENWVEYTSLGDVVNIAARLQQYARPNRVVVDAKTAAKITPRFSIHNIGEVEIRGRERSQRIFEVFFDFDQLEEFIRPLVPLKQTMEDEFFIR